MSDTDLALLLVVSALLVYSAVRRLRLSRRTVRKPLPDMKAEHSAETFPAPWKRKESLSVPELPGGYDETRVVLMVRDPDWLYAYWEIADEHRGFLDAALEGKPEDWRVTLRVYELDNKMAFFDLDVGRDLGDWHIQVNKPHTSFYCQLGLKNGGRFIPLAVSRPVTTPRNAMSDLADEEWMLVTDDEQRMLKRIGKLDFTLTSPFMFRKDN